MDITLSNGTAISLEHGAVYGIEHLPSLESSTSSGAVAEVIENPSQPGVLGLKNWSNSTWVVTTYSGDQKLIHPGQSIRLAEGTSISFGSITGVFSVQPQPAIVSIGGPVVNANAASRTGGSASGVGSAAQLPDGGTTSEERMLAVAACMTAHICWGAVPFIIFFVKKRDSKFVAFYSALGSMAGSLIILSFALWFLVFVVGTGFGLSSVAVGVAPNPIFSLFMTLVSLVTWLLLFLAFPVMLVVMVISAISAWHGKAVELPLFSPLARRFSGLR